MNELSYKLAKQLKDARFPQKYPTGEHNASGQKYWMHDPSDDDYIEILHDGKSDNALDDEQLTLIPTLSELIEACGDKFIRVGINTLNGINDYPFMVEGIFDEKNTVETPFVEFGETPLIAVAHLWLALNKL